MDQTTWLAKRNYWIAGSGAIISLVSFLAFPFLNVTYSIPSLFTGDTTSDTKSYLATELASSEGLLWVGLVLVLVILVGSIASLVRESPFGLRVPMHVQARYTALGFVVAGVLSGVCMVASFLAIQQDMQNAQDSLKIIGWVFSGLFHVEPTLGFGAYLFLAGLVTVVVAGLLEGISPLQSPSDREMATRPNYSQNQYPSMYTYPSE